MLIADLHIHSRFSRATSRECDAPHLDLWARRKGVASWARAISPILRGARS